MKTEFEGWRKPTSNSSPGSRPWSGRPRPTNKSSLWLGSESRSRSDLELGVGSVETRIRRLEEMGLDLKGRITKEEARRAWITQNALYFFPRLLPDQGVQTACCSNRIPRTLYWHFTSVTPLEYSNGKWFHEFGTGVLIRDEVFCDTEEETWYFNRYVNGNLASSTPAVDVTCDPLLIVFGESSHVTAEP